jgi:outer membrane protein assembly factor BamB
LNTAGDTIVMRLALVTLLFLPALVFGQTKPDEKDQDKVSNDNPARPLQMPPASTDVKEAIDDFERFSRRQAWERALKAIYTIPEDQALRFLDGENGFIIPVARKRRLLLTALPPEGQAAYRLFYDAEARKLLDEADGPAELANLERIYSAYFTTTVGDNAADRLGDLYFEIGRFDRAADCWLAILREHPDTDLSPAALSLKTALALYRGGRRAELEQIKSEMADRYNDDKVTLGGQTASAGELLRRFMSDEKAVADPVSPSASPAAIDGPRLTEAVDPAWQMRFAELVEAGMTPLELTQWQANTLSAVVPAATVDGSSLFVNYLGHLFAIDLVSGKMLWRSASFHHLELLTQQNMARALDPTRFAIVASGEYVWGLAKDLKDQNFFASFQLICRRADKGEIVWKSADLPDYAMFDLVGQPILADGKLYIAAKSQANPQMRQGLPQQFVLAIQPHDGKVLWKTEVGTFRQGQQYYYYYMPDSSPQPRLVYRAGAVYLDTHVGVLARLDAETGAFDWGYGYKTAPFQSGYPFFYYYMNQEPQAIGGPPLETGEALLVKGMQSERLYAIEPNKMKVLWERPITKASRLLGVDERAVYLGGDELSAVDLKTRKLLWATRVPNGSMDGRVLVRPDGLWQLTARGIYEIDPRSGDVRRIFRGKDLGVVGGDLLLTDHWLLAISNRTITAYPRRASRTEVTARDDSATSKGAASP